jgi:hypothetical protein
MPEAIPFSPTPLTPGQRWLCCLAVAIKRRDPVLLTQIAERVEQHCPSERHYQRLVAELTGSLELQGSDWQWLRGLLLEA